MSHNRMTDYTSPGDDNTVYNAATRVLPPLDQAPQTPDLYAMAWTLAIRDHELDKLFNSDFYEI